MRVLVIVLLLRTSTCGRESESPASQIAGWGTVRTRHTSTGPGAPTPALTVSFHPPQSTVLVEVRVAS